jgi:hypothetical protein
MAAGDEYRRKAAELEAKAKTNVSERQSAAFEHLAKAYRRLARQAEQNQTLDIVWEPPLPKPRAGSV